jgi:hypothetical protein
VGLFKAIAHKNGHFLGRKRLTHPSALHNLSIKLAQDFPLRFRLDPGGNDSPI